MTNRMVPTSAITTAPPELLGSGTRDGTRFLRDDGVWAAPHGAGIDRAAEGHAAVPNTGTVGTTDLNLAATVTAAGDHPPTNPTYANDGSNTTETVRASYSTGAGTTYGRWVADLGSSQTVGGMTVRQQENGVAGGTGFIPLNMTDNDRANVEYSDDGVSWTNLTTSISETVETRNDGNGDYVRRTYAFLAPVSARYWRLSAIHVSAGLGFVNGVGFGTWSIWDTVGGGVYDPAPELVDGDDATFRWTTGTAVCRVDLGAAYRIVRSRILIAPETSGAKSYPLYGANASDYSDEVLLGTFSFTAAGSYAASDQTITFNVGAYRYYRLGGGGAARRHYTIELWDAEALGISDHGALSGLADDDHPQYALDTDLSTHAGLPNVHHNRQHSITSGSDHTFPGGTSNFLREDGTWAAPSGGAALSNATPLVESGAGSAGTATDASRSDHVHPAAGVGTGDVFYQLPDVTNYAAAFTAGSASCAVTVPAPAAGDKLVAVVYGSGRGANSITQTNVTWTRRYTGNGNSQFLEVWTGVASGTGGTTATAAFTGNNSQFVEIFTLNGAASAFTSATAAATGTAAGTALATVSASGLTVGSYILLATVAAGPTSSYSGASHDYRPLGAFGGQGRSGIFRANGKAVSYWSLSSSAVSYFTAIITLA